MTMKKLSSLLLVSAAAFGLSASLYSEADAGPRSYSSIENPHSNNGGIRIQSPGEGGATYRSIVLPFSKSTVVELPENVMDVIVSNPELVEAVVHTGKRTVLIGKEAGQTNVFFYGHDGEELLNLDIRVERDIGGLQELINKNAPTANVEVQSFNGNMLLTGTVPNASTADRVEKLAKMWIETSGRGFFSSTSGEIVNLMAIEGKDQVMLKARIVESPASVADRCVNNGLRAKMFN